MARIEVFPTRSFGGISKSKLFLTKLNSFNRYESWFASSRLWEVRDNCRGQEAEEQDQRFHLGGVLGEEEDQPRHRIWRGDSSCGEEEARWLNTKTDLYPFIKEVLSIPQKVFNLMTNCRCKCHFIQIVLRSSFNLHPNLGKPIVDESRLRNFSNGQT